MTDDITCAHCGEPVEVHYLRHDAAQDTTPPPGGHYRATLSGQGCPFCGYDHDGPGAHDLERVAALAGGVTDDDPLEFL